MRPHLSALTVACLLLAAAPASGRGWSRDSRNAGERQAAGRVQLQRATANLLQPFSKLAGRLGSKTQAARQARQATLNRRIESIDLARVNNAPKLSKEEVASLVGRARQRLGVDFRLEWESNSKSIWHKKGKPIVVPRGLIEQPGLTADGLALILSHEAAHAKGKKQELDADYWATRHGLRKLWGRKAFSGPVPERALLAAYSALHSQHAPCQIELAGPRKAKVTLHASGYPSLQSRWDIYKAGSLGQRKPRVGHREPEGTLELLTSKQAASYLGVSEKWLVEQGAGGKRPMRVNLPDGVRYIRDDLDTFKGPPSR